MFQLLNIKNIVTKNEAILKLIKASNQILTDLYKQRFRDFDLYRKNNFFHKQLLDMSCQVYFHI
ncbi:hypothetical protein BpHYR1_007892 [Brachionus plicatilis]|uniref:Uncharacterized protein n=1 Tax=Brachionus plicatilis TaxID=10195 RepID=A0A3M7QIB5_BRAPC|nr:hypothetical protein BpHYR1_007892 [Brachionus plicatilis]